MRKEIVMSGRAVGKKESVKAAMAEMLGASHATHVLWVHTPDPTPRPGHWRSIFDRPIDLEDFPAPLELGRYDCAGRYRLPLSALTARPVQGSHRFMETKSEIPAADPDAGYSIRIGRAIDALDDAIMTTRTPALTPAQRKRILDILGAV